MNVFARSLRAAACAAVLFCSNSVGAAALTLEQIRDYVFPTEVIPAGAGNIAWVASDRGRSNVWVATAPGFEGRQLTAYTEDDGQALSSLRASADGRWLVYVRGGDHGANWQKDVPVNPASLPVKPDVAIWSVPLAGGKPRRLAEADFPQLTPDGRFVVFARDEALWRVPVDGSSEPAPWFFVRGGVGSPAWSPDGKQVAFVSHRGTHSFIGIYTDERTPIRWLAPSTTRDISPRWSPDGRQVAFVRKASKRKFTYPGPTRFWPADSQYLKNADADAWSIWVADAASGEARQWWSSTDGRLASDGGWFAYLDWAAGGALVFMSYQDGWRHLYSLSAAGRTPTLLTPGDYSIDEVTLTADRRHLVYTANTGRDPHDIDRRHLFKVAVDRPGPVAITSGTGIEWTPVMFDDRQVLFVSATAQRPPQPALVPLAGGQIRLLTANATRASYPAQRLVVPEKVAFKAADGVTVHGQLFLPPKAGKRAHPAVVYIHGGPGPQQVLGWHPSDYYSNDYAVNQYLASQGFVVLTVNYRSDSSYGYEYNFAPNIGTHGASEYQDIRAAGLYLQSRPEVVAARVGVYGGSYGGYLTAMALAHDSDLFKAGVDIHGVHDWIEQYDLKNLLAQQPFDSPLDAQRALDIVWRSSPMSAVATWKSPVLFISGDDDRNVHFEQTLELVRRLERTDVSIERLVLPDETHALLRYANVLKIDAATVEFLQRHLGQEHPAGQRVLSAP